MRKINEKNDIFVCPKTGRIFKKKKSLLTRWPWLFPFVGLLALIWFLIRVVPKPKRMEYPCQRVAAPIAFNFLSGTIGFLGLTALIHRFRKHVKTKPFIIIASLILMLGLGIVTTVSFTNVEVKAITTTTASKPNAPIGVARGIFPGRVVWVHDASATSWDGINGYYGEDKYTDQTVVNKMLSEAITELTGQSTDKKAWESIFTYFNKTHGKGSVGYKKGEKIAIKVNLNGQNSQSKMNNSSFTSPQVIDALLHQLVTVAGVLPSSITVYDASRVIPDVIYDRCSKGVLKGVNFVDFDGGNGRISAVRDPKSKIQWSFDVKGNPTYLPTCVTKSQYLINLSSMKGHNLAGVSLCAKNHFGTIMSNLAGRPTKNPPQGANIHGYVSSIDYGWGEPAWTFPKCPMGTYNALVDLMGHKDLGEKTLLFINDSLYVSKDQISNVDSTCKWTSAPFNNDWPSSILISQDGVAMDSVGYDFLNSEPVIKTAKDVLIPGNTAENYLHEAALANNSPSKTVYDPEGDGKRLPSLGVHEHWNNAKDKKYSRNLSKNGKGIELIVK
jgi:hypothetical protein